MMIRSTIAVVCSLLVLIMVTQMSAAQPKYFMDDFEDGSVTDNSPVNWVATTSVFPVEGHVIGGNFEVTPTHSFIIGWSGFEVEGAIYHDVSLTTHVPASGAVMPFLFARKSGSFFGPGPLVVGGYEYGQDSASMLYLAYQGSPFAKIEQPVDWTENNADIELKLDVVGDHAFLSAWPITQAPPTLPQLSILIPNGPADEGSAGLLALNLASDPRAAAFRDFAASAIPEPSTFALATLGLLTLAASKNCRIAGSAAR